MDSLSDLPKALLVAIQTRSDSAGLWLGFLAFSGSILGVLRARRGKDQPVGVLMALVATAAAVGALVWYVSSAIEAALPSLGVAERSTALSYLLDGVRRLTFVVGLALCPACFVLIFGTPVHGESQGPKASLLGVLLLTVGLTAPLLFSAPGQSKAVLLGTLGVELIAGLRLVAVLLRRPDSAEAVDGQRLCAAAFLLLVRQLDATALLTQVVDWYTYPFSGNAVETGERQMVQRLIHMDQAAMADFARVALVALIPLLVLNGRQGYRRTALLTPIVTAAVLFHLVGTDPRIQEMFFARTWVAELPEWRRVPIVCAEGGALPPASGASVPCPAFLATDGLP